jgi:hypothetical protein
MALSNGGSDGIMEAEPAPELQVTWSPRTAH